jgi:hypothetical protein
MRRAMHEAPAIAVFPMQLQELHQVREAPTGPL